METRRSHLELFQNPKEALQQQLADRYTIQSFLSRGGVADLYIATPLLSGASASTADTSAPSVASSQVVLKMLRPLLAMDDMLHAMFQDEIRLMRQLSHPHVVRYIEGNPDSNPPYLILEYILGCDLGHLLFHYLPQQQEPLPIAVAFAISLGIAEALGYLHHAQSGEGISLQLIHRDLSPPNVLLGEQGEVKLTDFGIALYETMGRQTSGDEPKGKFSYLAPEMLLSLPIDQRADIFSWGVLTWELLTGHRLFEAEDPEGTLKLLSEAPILTPQELNPLVPTDLNDLTMLALQRNREQRPSDIRILLDTLRHIRTQYPHAQEALCDMMKRLPSPSQPHSSTHHMQTKEIR